jgi:hypothetical protein
MVSVYLLRKGEQQIPSRNLLLCFQWLLGVLDVMSRRAIIKYVVAGQSLRRMSWITSTRPR